MDLVAFHFLRPLWLVLLVPVAWISWSLFRAKDPARQWRNLVAPALLPHLLIDGERRSEVLAPPLLLTLLLLLGVIGAAGPSWNKEPAPFSEDQAALFLVMEVSPSMQAQDIQPSRQERAAHKVSELLKLRSGTRTGLIAYAGSAHLVMPLTSDPGVIDYFAAELDPAVMPVEGDEPAQAVALAMERIQSSGLAGSVVLLTDFVGAEHLPAIKQAHEQTGVSLHILGIAAGADVVPPDGSPTALPLDEDALAAAARAGGGSLVVVSPGDEDVVSLDRSLERSIAAAPVQEGQRWKDFGYFLLWPLMFLMLPFFRKGGAVTWN